jgi:hypothetical protein
MEATFCLKSSCSTASHQDPSEPFTFDDDIIVIKKSETVAFSEPSASCWRMDPELLEHWTSNPKSLKEWGEALLAFKRCLVLLPYKTGGSRDYGYAVRQEEIPVSNAGSPNASPQFFPRWSRS